MSHRENEEKLPERVWINFTKERPFIYRIESNAPSSAVPFIPESLAAKREREGLAQRELEAYLGCLRMAELCTKEEFLDYMRRVIEQAESARAPETKGPSAVGDV